MNTVTLPPTVQAAYDTWARANDRVYNIMSRPHSDEKFNAAGGISELAYALLVAECKANGIDPDSIDNPEYK